MKIIQFLFVLIFFKSTSPLLFNGNSTWKDFLKCKEFDVSDGYNYRQFFQINEFTQKSTSELDNETIINIEIAVLATRDAHILLTSQTSTTTETIVYEIVLGAGSNTFSEIRRFKKKSPLKTKSTPNILSIIRPIPINIVYKRLGETGRLDVFINGEPFPLLSYIDSTIVDIKYISFTSWGSTEAKWFYDCEQTEDSKLNNLVPEPKNLTPIQQLREKFWLLAQFHLDELENETKVNITLEIEQFNYSLQDLLLSLRGIIRIKWYDFRNVWDPEEFDNISIYRGNVPIWYPYLSLVNGMTKDIELDTGFRYILYHNGSVEAISKPVELNTWCLAKYRSKSWPNDNHDCHIQFGTRNKFVKFGHPDFVKYNSGNNFGYWRIGFLWYDTEYEKIPFLHIDEINGLNDTNYPQSFNIHINFQRNQEFCGKLFFTPLIASLVLILFSFWIEHPYRCGLSALTIVIQVGVLLTMSKYIPYDYVPTIVQYYYIGLYFSCSSIIFIIISLWFTQHLPENPPKPWIINVIDNPVLRIVLALGVLESKEDFNGQQLLWIQLKQIFDRIFSILVLMFILIILIKGY